MNDYVLLLDNLDYIHFQAANFDEAVYYARLVNPSVRLINIIEVQSLSFDDMATLDDIIAQCIQNRSEVKS